MQKNILILWTGGLDSTYLLIRNLQKDNKIYTGFVNIGNNEEPMSAEKEARGKLRVDIQKIHNEAKYKGSWVHPNTDYELNYITQYSFQDYPYGQLPLFINSIVSCMDSFDEIQMAFVYNDYNNVKGFTKRVRDIYNGYKRLMLDTTIEPTMTEYAIWHPAKLKFPLTKTTKVDEILYIYDLDQKYGTHILENTVHCERCTTDKCDCNSCKNYNNAYEEAMKIINNKT